MKKILVAEDEDVIRDFVVINLRRSGYDVVDVPNGDEAIRVFDQNNGNFDICLLDIMMPGKDGFTVCKEIRKRSSTVGIIMLSAKGQEMDKVGALMFGADDYVTKPFSPKELMMRVQAVLRRTNILAAPTKEILEFEGLKVDFTGRMVFVDGKQISLSPKEYALFFYMVRNRGIALTREKLINDVWGYDFFGDDRTLDTHIKLLRKALGEYSRYIVTLRGVGYRFEAQ